MMNDSLCKAATSGRGAAAAVWLTTLAFLALAAMGGCRQESPATNPPSPATDPSPATADMVLIPAGDFLMGSASNVDSVPVHKVSVAAFYIDKYEVTQELYEKITGKNPSRRKDPKNPVERVRWREAAAFCNQRSAAEGLKPCYDAKTWVCDFSADGYHLPTEAQWEYACRGGSAGVYSFGDDSADLKSYGWFKATADRKTHPVGELKANPFGLFDVAGNVAEWCNDWYGRDYYAQSPAADPTGPSSGEKKVVRGGGFKSAAEDCTCAARNSDEPGFSDACVASDDYGFRCVRRAAPK